MDPGIHLKPATLEDLDADIEQALVVLNEKQRTFITHMVDGDTSTAADAARLAGYSDNRARQAAHEQRNNPKVAHAIQLLQWRKELRIGIDAARKRQILMNVAEIHQVETPAASVSAVKELNAMDGDHAALQIKHSGSLTTVAVDYQLNLGRDVPVIEGEATVVEDDDCDLF